MEENPLAGVVFDDDETVIEYDAEGNPIIPEKNKVSSHSASNFVLWVCVLAYVLKMTNTLRI